MNLDEARALLPPSSSLRKLLPKLLSTDEDKVSVARDRLARGKKIAKREALARVRIASELTFPKAEHEWDDTPHEILFPLVENPYPEVVPLVVAAYPRVGPHARCALLAILGAIGTRAAASAFMSCIRAHGWPKNVYGRVFSELPKLLPHAHVLFPELVEIAGSQIGPVTNVLVGGLSSGKLKLDLEPLAPLVVKNLAKTLPRARKHQRANGIEWRFAEKYFGARRDAGAWLDVAGYLRDKRLTPHLRRALAFRDPWLVAFAAVSTLRRGGDVPRTTLERLAACHETRELLFDYLDALGALSRFPAAWRTWDAFAAAEMVRWLMYPTELGREPDALEKMAVLTSGKRTLYVWRFRTGRKPWQAGVSGLYVLRGKPRPIHGTSTFSRFDKWDSATPEEHALNVLETLKSWRRRS